ncbi:MAG TPA: pantoate--beta-alanine ligase [Solirubrobacterales bacterium]|nr:pantoate--beta-alanine ligase [Solirubrobacterales bacterium]
MRELERTLVPTPTERAPIVVVGRGRVGTSLSAAAREAGVPMKPASAADAPHACRGATAALLCVPDVAIAATAASLASDPPALVGHVSGATTLDPLAASAASAVFSLHPLQTFGGASTPLASAPAAVAGSDPAAESFAVALAEALGMIPFSVPDQRRAAYHAAASIASNFFVALEESATGLMDAAGIEDARELLAPLVLRTAANWAERGPDALTGPIARGDAATVERHREALAETAPELLPLYEAMAERTRALGNPRARQPRGGRGLMRTVRTKAALREALEPERRAGRRIGLVPTMGCFHEGHLALMRRAQAECDIVVVSLFVNPTQFGPGEDLEIYPRDEAHDAELASAEGVDLLFAPSAEEMYPDGPGAVVEVDLELTGVLDGDPERRGPGHFHGVTTIVAKLFNCVGPDAAYFGRKDAQQAVVIERMVHDLDFPVEIVVVPTVREESGLAMSSRNSYLDAAERERAAALSRGLRAAERAAAEGERSAEALVEAVRAELRGAEIEPEYVEARDAESLAPVNELNGRPVLVAVAARVGRARLIDSVVLGGDTDKAKGEA